MLTPRQQEILELIVQLYADLEVPIGSKTLLKESYLKVSPATIRNDMVVLEQNGFLVKAHTSSGRIPSNEGYQYYVDRLLDTDKWKNIYDSDRKAVSELFRNRPADSFMMAKIVADLFVSLTGFPCLVFGQSKEEHKIADFKLIRLEGNSIMSILVTDLSHVESQLYRSHFSLSDGELSKVSEIINVELRGVPLEDAYHRLKLTIPLLLQRQVSQLIDFSPLIEKAIQQLKGHRYSISGKNNLFDVMDRQITPRDFKNLFNLLDGSKELFDTFEQRSEGIEVLFGQDFAPKGMQNLALVMGTFTLDVQKMTISILGSSTMKFSRMITLMDQMIKEFTN
ncbi:heat-inducible transcription repressor HrcA [Facklamia sp. DSM 111018]|uniref:Heat-inducible transcription repressor HrcA n=1 Tax=Facklamia lactis TaxID=2749967 RepID=A0ABS0LMD5_9LACT|nr:heat-inducible transcriptional repressor HrcA [Facklamia lactis]MBG9980016.1 heat-inducible transcription repressor HrcA [Facklamia lactis]MBG9985304.1 heat-inducible transcription repressor HrcA [Facklamia lactis]